MKKHNKFIIFMIIASVLAVGSSNIFAETDEDFANNTDYYKNKCRNYSSGDAELCQQYKEWLIRDSESTQNDLATLNEQLAANNKTINEQNELLKQYQEDIENAEAEILNLEIEIGVKEDEIAALEVEIEEKKEVIAAKEAQVLQYIGTLQNTMRINTYIDFVMGANSFSDMMRRTAGFNSIKQYNEEVIEELGVQKKELEADQVELVNIQEQLILDKDLADSKRIASEDKKEVVEVLVANIRAANKDIAETIEQQEKKEALNDDLMSLINKKPDSNGGGGGIQPSGGWGPIVSGSWYKSAHVWEYDGGGNHFGLDMAAAVGTPLLAPGNGIITVARGGCATYGGYPNSCNGGWGNYVTMIIDVNGTIYGVLLAHQRADSITVSPGELVSAGTRVGEVGSSGASTGPHVHVEIYYLGDDSIGGAYSRWSGSNTFDTGSASAGSWDKLCHNNGNQYPCRMDPETFY